MTGIDWQALFEMATQAGPVSAPELFDDHGNPAVWMVCDNCELPSLCLYVYSVDPWLRWLGHDEGCALDWDEFGYGCSNCVPVLAFCADTEACRARGGRKWEECNPTEGTR